jgi:hypothetical protein
MRTPGFLLLAALSSAAAAQDPGDQEIPPVDYPAIVRTAAAPAGFIPKGWKQVQLAEGDLNRDGKPDFAMVVRMDSTANRIAPSWAPDTRYDTNPWMLIAAFRTGSGYDLVVADHSLIPRHENPNADDEFDEIKIANGTLKVVMHLFLSAGGWQMGGSAYTFRWQDGGFKLIGFDRDSVMRNSGETEEVSINYLTGHKELKTGNIGSDEEQTKSIRMRRKPLLDLTAIGDGLMFDPDER